MYIETSKPTQGDTAILRSPIQHPSASAGQGCFDFWYHMYGADIGQLTVSYVTDFGTTSEVTTVKWALYGEQSPDDVSWLHGQFTVPRTTNYQVG